MIHGFYVFGLWKNVRFIYPHIYEFVNVLITLNKVLRIYEVLYSDAIQHKLPLIKKINISWILLFWPKLDFSSQCAESI